MTAKDDTLEIDVDGLIVPVKRKADDHDYNPPKPKLRKCRKKRGQDPSEHEVKREPGEESIGGSVDSTGRIIAHPGTVTELKGMSRLLERRRRCRHIVLDPSRCDLQVLDYELKLKALMRMPGTGRWACPVSCCTQSYTRKSHMKSHIADSKEPEHMRPRIVFKKTFCCVCVDHALDDLFERMKKYPEMFRGFWEILKNLEQLERNLTDHPEVVEGGKDLEQFERNLTNHPEVVEGGNDKSQASTPATGSKIQEDSEKEATARDEEGNMTPGRQQAHISKIVEQLSKSTRSDTEEGSKSEDKTDTSDTAVLRKGSRRGKKRCSISIPPPSLQTSNKDHGRRLTPSNVSEGESIPRDYVTVPRSDGEASGSSTSPAVQSNVAEGESIPRDDVAVPKSDGEVSGSSTSPVVQSNVAEGESIPRDYVTVPRSDGEASGSSTSPAVQSNDRRGADTQYQPIANPDFYNPNPAEVMQRAHIATNAAHIAGNDMWMAPYPYGINSDNVPDWDDGLRLSRHYQPNFVPGRQLDRFNANGLSALDWEPRPYSEYGYSERPQYWVPAGASPFATQTFGLTYDNTSQRYPYNNTEDPVFFNRLMQPLNAQPLFYQLPQHDSALGATYYGATPHQVPHQQMQTCFNNGLINHANDLEQQSDILEQESDCSETRIKKDPSVDEQSGNSHEG